MDEIEKVRDGGEQVRMDGCRERKSNTSALSSLVRDRDETERRSDEASASVK